MNLYRLIIKRGIDIVLSGCALLTLSPLLAMIACWLHVANKGAGAFFFQPRPGKNGKVFRVVKFKTMTDERDDAGNLLPDTERITKIGQLMRSTSIDELPQLWNVLKGEMSLIGPRPLLVKYLPYYTQRELHRHDVRPGITGLSQVNGRNHLEWDEKLEMDVQYTESISLTLDLKIFFKTIRNVFTGSDIELLSESHDLDIIRKNNVIKLDKGNK